MNFFLCGMSKSVIMVSIMLLLSVWTCLYAILSTVFTIADDTYPRNLLKIVGNSHIVAVIVYAFTLIAAAISLWEAWKATVTGGAGVFSG